MLESIMLLNFTKLCFCMWCGSMTLLEGGVLHGSGINNCGIKSYMSLSPPDIFFLIFAQVAMKSGAQRMNFTF